ncbi:L-seryl-tRNA(Sec) kinase [Calliphora vicina]|uniref:L-seryl-tRNA(Sec) kinase n=1 Tax=Calliphora vicina TaxID=7373 RepID=UPI00325B1E63
MNRICLVALIGLPAAGKSSVCTYLREMDSLPFNILHLCYDYYVNFNLDSPTQYKEQRDKLLKSLSTIIQTFNVSNNLTAELIGIKSLYSDHQQKDAVILCDDNHYYRSMRYKLYQLAREHGIGYCQIYLESSIAVSLKRNSLRSVATKVPTDVIVQMSKRLEAPNAGAHKWEENTLIVQNLNLNRNISKNIISHIIQFLDKPVQPLQLSVAKSKTPQSIVHDLDLLMRKRINILMSSKLEENKKLLAKILNDKRKEILKEFQLNLSDKLEDDLDMNKYVEMLN